MGHIHAILAPEDFARYRTAFDAAHTFDHPDTPTPEKRTAEQRGADALIVITNAALNAGAMPTSHGVKPHLTLTARLNTITGEDDEAGETAYGDLLPAETVRRIACDAGLTRAILSATSQVLDIGRETASWTVAKHKAAALTFGGCAFPVAEGQACGRPPAWCELHHIQYWSKGGQTNLDNGSLLCTRHHHTVHDDGWKLTYDPATMTITVTKRRATGEIRRTVIFGVRNATGDVDNPAEAKTASGSARDRSDQPEARRLPI